MKFKHTKNRKVKNNPFIFIPDQFIHSDYPDILSPLDHDSYTTYYEACELPLFENSGFLIHPQQPEGLTLDPKASIPTVPAVQVIFRSKSLNN